LGKIASAVLGAFHGFTAIAGYYIFGRFGDRLNVRKCLYCAVVLGSVTSFFYLWASGVVSLYVLALLSGPVSGFIHVAYLAIAVKNCPKMAEGFSYALLMSVFNIANALNAGLGGRLYGLFEKAGVTDTITRDGAWSDVAWRATGWLTELGVSPHLVGLRPLMIISALFTLVTLFFIPWMRLDRKGVMKHDEKEISWPAAMLFFTLTFLTPVCLVFWPIFGNMVAMVLLAGIGALVLIWCGHRITRVFADRAR